MEELNLEILNEIFEEVIDLDNPQFLNLYQALIPFNEEIDQSEMADYLTENFSVTTEGELADMADYEKNTFVEYIINVY
ncbi:hypothetical protein EZV73_12170 [Acidaminobacter sp. JC074]|uniref:hypothetical protein n=1 Tax=Acidaminobacter sp. JC074 TaxID=2530199 RepID=UPI001F0CEBF1|nr:hypothetical protein [Acidaminobacter sp. JC074]MCH4888337.1 hypothetical protein [Acidaminobacter sp. JC074]